MCIFSFLNFKYNFSVIVKRMNPIIPIATIIDIIDTIVRLLGGLVTKGFRF